MYDPAPPTGLSFPDSEHDISAASPRQTRIIAGAKGEKEKKSTLWPVFFRRLTHGRIFTCNRETRYPNHLVTGYRNVYKGWPTINRPCKTPRFTNARTRRSILSIARHARPSFLLSETFVPPKSRISFSLSRGIAFPRTHLFDFPFSQSSFRPFHLLSNSLVVREY